MRKDFWLREAIGGDSQDVVCNLLHTVFLTQEVGRRPKVGSG